MLFILGWFCCFGVCVCVCVCVCVRARACIYIYIYTHTHTRAHTRNKYVILIPVVFTFPITKHCWFCQYSSFGIQLALPSVFWSRNTILEIRFNFAYWCSFEETISLLRHQHTPRFRPVTGLPFTQTVEHFSDVIYIPVTI